MGKILGWGGRGPMTDHGLATRTVALLVLAAVSSAADAQSASPYAQLEPRRIKALSADREQGLAAGAGLGYAMAAELNGQAGPKHVLELAEALGLTAEQRSAVEASLARMKQEAVALGGEILVAEAELDRRLAHRHLDEAGLAELTGRIAGFEGRLRFVHLRAHLETDAILTPEQRGSYTELRGYGASGSGHGEGREHLAPAGGRK